MLSRKVFGLFAGLLLTCAHVQAQQALGSITGRIMDPQGAVVAGVAVTIVNTETNRTTRSTSNDTGYFEANFLDPGKYNVSVEQTGFKKSLRTGLDLQVAGRLEVNFTLEIGATAETVQVTAQAPLLDTTTASGGRVIDARQITQLPISDLNPFALATIAPGMTATGQPEYVRPFDNGGTSGFETMGGVGSNEYTIDGAPVTGTGRRVGFNPPADSVEEFKLETTPFDASYGFTSGATVNVSSRGGTNTFHGSLFDQHWQQRWNATPHFTRLAYEDGIRSGRIAPGTPKQGPGRSNNFGGMLSGPVVIPKLFNGRDKLFFTFTYNGIYQKKAETTSSINNTVPNMSWREGDFSDVLAIDPVRFQLYDPRTARLVNGRVVRDPFPNNRIPILNPMAKFYNALFPVPNNVPGLVSPEGFNNYYAAAMPKDEKFNSLVHRMDYNLGEKHRIFGRWYYNRRLADEYDWTYETMRGLHTNGLVRMNKGAGADWIWTLSSNHIMNAAVTWTRFSEGSESPVRTQFKPSDVGLPAYLDARAGDLHLLPRLDFEGNNESRGSNGGINDVSDSYPWIGTKGATGEARVQFTSIRGSHSFKYGYNERYYWFAGGSPGNTSGIIGFNNSWTRETDVTNTAARHAHEYAAFLLGLPSGISIDTNDTNYYTTPYRAAYFQDDWRLTSKLRLNLGLRYEWAGGTRERFNRAIAGGFDYDVQYPFEGFVRQQYASLLGTAQGAGLPDASQLNLRGGVHYLGEQTDTWTKGAHTLMPKIGVVYQLTPKTVIRTGYGWWYDVFNVNNDRPVQDGFSQATGTVLSTDNGLTFCCGVGSASNLSSANTPLNDPFPATRAGGARFDEPFGNSLGSLIRVGRGFTTGARPYEFTPARQQRWRFAIQRELTSNMVIEASYNGSFANYYIERRVDYLPQQYWATGMTRRQDIDDYLNANITNPFRLTGTNAAALNMDARQFQWLTSQVGRFNGQNIARNQLLRPYPHLNNVVGVRPDLSYDGQQGNVIYNDLQLQFERRFSKGFHTSVLYTYADSRDAWYANEFSDQWSWRVNNDARPHRFVWSAIYEVPFGKGRQFVTDNPIQHVIGGWNLSWIYQYQTGPAFGFGNRFFYGDTGQIDELLAHDETWSNDIHQWFNPNAVFRGSGSIPQGFTGFEGRASQQPGNYHVRLLPDRFKSLREDGIRKWDFKVERQFRITESFRSRFSVDLLNAFNTTMFGGPTTDPTNLNFGRVTSQRGPSRIIQLNLRFEF